MQICDQRPSHAVGICALTSLDRDSWADARERLIELSPENEKHLDAIQSAYNVLALDDEAYPSVILLFLHW